MRTLYLAGVRMRCLSFSFLQRCWVSLKGPPLPLVFHHVHWMCKFTTVFPFVTAVVNVYSGSACCCYAMYVCIVVTVASAADLSCVQCCQSTKSTSICHNFPMQHSTVLSLLLLTLLLSTFVLRTQKIYVVQRRFT